MAELAAHDDRAGLEKACAAYVDVVRQAVALVGAA
jgi:hypothetical protein